MASAVCALVELNGSKLEKFILLTVELSQVIVVIAVRQILYLPELLALSVLADLGRRFRVTVRRRDLHVDGWQVKSVFVSQCWRKRTVAWERTLEERKLPLLLLGKVRNLLTFLFLLCLVPQ